MVSFILFILLLGLFVLALVLVENLESWVPIAFWFILIFVWIILLFTGFHLSSGNGQYQGYVTAVEQDGVIFKGYKAYLKTELESSNEDIACINREDEQLINELKEALKNKAPVTLHYESMLEYRIGECPGSDWMIMDII